MNFKSIKRLNINAKYCQKRFYRSRLQENYYAYTIHDLMILQYDHDSPNILQLENSKEWNRAMDQVTVAEIFAKPLDFLPSNAVPKSTPTTNLLDSETLKIVKQREKDSKILETYHYNPIDYTLVNKETAKEAQKERQQEYNLAHIKPFTPLLSRLPLLKEIELTVFSKQAMLNKYVTLSAIMALTNMTCVTAVPFFSEISDAALGVKKGQVCGARVVLTNWQMYNFLDTLVQVVFPRLRDFVGVNPKTNDDRSLTLTLDEQAMGLFPGIESVLEMFPQLFEFQIVLKTTGQMESEVLSLLSSFQVPFLPDALEESTSDESKEVDPWAEFKKKRKPVKKLRK